MMSPEFQQHLAQHQAVFEEKDGEKEVESFSNQLAEFQAMQCGCGVCPVSKLDRILLSGGDRVKFLHNFCTNDIKSLSAGRVVEAFFTDVKARILAHGYVAAFPDSLEIWMLPGNADRLVQHLNKYIIVEDVTVSLADSQEDQKPTFLAISGPHTSKALTAVSHIKSFDTGSCFADDQCSAICVTWANQPLVLMSVNSQAAVASWDNLCSAGATPCGRSAFEAVRISERFPLIDVDLSPDNMAPEAGRNDSAICYTKGCYLGQEPIARLDAMGHVNRMLYSGTVEATEPDPQQAESKCPIVSSVVPNFTSPESSHNKLALAVLPVKQATTGAPVLCQSSNGDWLQFRPSN